MLAQRERDVVEEVHRAEQRAVLEQHAEQLAGLVELVLAAAGDVDVADDDRAVVRLQQADQRLEEHRGYVVRMSAAPAVLLEVTRDSLVESRHRGHFGLLSADGAVAVRAGDIDSPRFARSALKPLQAVAMVEAGYPGRDGRPGPGGGQPRRRADASRAGARAILTSAGLDESALGCPPGAADGRGGAARLPARGRRGRVDCHNCSGKHAAMLATCVAAGWPPPGYPDPAHLLQGAARSIVEAYADEPVASIAVDGCGAPAFALSLAGLARAFAQLALAGPGSSAALVRDATRAHPQLVGGTGWVVSELMAGVPGLLAKDGAEGIWAAGAARWPSIRGEDR